MGPWHVKMPHKTCWGCDCCWCWCLETCWRQFVADLEADVLVIKLNFCSNFEHKVWSRFWSWSPGEILKLRFSQYFMVKILKLKFRQDFEADVWSVFCCWCLVEVTKLNLGQYSEARFGQDLNLRFSRCLVEILKLMLSRDCEIVICSICLWTVYCDLVIWTQPSGPLCLWQCLKK